MLKFEGKALVTGGAGFIGSHVAREVMKLGMDVVVLDDLSGGFEENIPLGRPSFVETSPIIPWSTGSSTSTVFESSIISRPTPPRI